MIAPRLATPVSASIVAARSISWRWSSIVRRAWSSSSIVPRSSRPSRSLSGEAAGSRMMTVTPPPLRCRPTASPPTPVAVATEPSSRGSSPMRTPRRSSSRAPPDAWSRPSSTVAVAFQSRSRSRPSKRSTASERRPASSGSRFSSSSASPSVPPSAVASAQVAMPISCDPMRATRPMTFSMSPSRPSEAAAMPTRTALAIGATGVPSPMSAATTATARVPPATAG